VDYVLCTHTQYQMSLNVRLLERTLWTAGILLVSAYAVHRGTGLIRARADVARVVSARAAFAVAPPNTQDWSEKRINLWRVAEVRNTATPLGVLRIGRLAVEVPILAGTSDEVLDRGVGHIEDTAAPGTRGNIGIAGHRDGFFRPLKDIAIGDRLDLETVTGHSTYRVEKIWVVNPDDVSVLDPTETASVTLVTCYPFYFIGSAPQRLIVRAIAVASGESRSSS
jgi:sortase A